MASVHFHIQGKHESQTGSAEVINSASEIKLLFANQYNISEKLVSVNKIGVVTIDGVDYEVYESYYDSGSEDYMYFAVMNATIRIGDTVKWSGAWGTQPERGAVITGIELCAAPRMKYGQQVTSVSIEDKDRCVFDLSTGNWAYGSQIRPL